MRSIALDKAESTGLLPQKLASRSVLHAPSESFEHCRQSLLSSGVLSKVGAHSYEFRWGSDPAFSKLDHKQANAVYILCVAESAKILAAGTTQAVLDKLVKTAAASTAAATTATTTATPAAPVTTQESVGAKPLIFPWGWIAVGAVVLGGGFYLAIRKRGH